MHIRVTPSIKQLILNWPILSYI